MAEPAKFLEQLNKIFAHVLTEGNAHEQENAVGRLINVCRNSPIKHLYIIDLENPSSGAPSLVHNQTTFAQILELKNKLLADMPGEAELHARIAEKDRVLGQRNTVIKNLQQFIKKICSKVGPDPALDMATANQKIAKLMPQVDLVGLGAKAEEVPAWIRGALWPTTSPRSGGADAAVKKAEAKLAAVTEALEKKELENQQLRDQQQQVEAENQRLRKENQQLQTEVTELRAKGVTPVRRKPIVKRPRTAPEDAERPSEGLPQETMPPQLDAAMELPTGTEAIAAPMPLSRRRPKMQYPFRYRLMVETKQDIESLKGPLAELGVRIASVEQLQELSPT